MRVLQSGSACLVAVTNVHCSVLSALSDMASWVARVPKGLALGTDKIWPGSGSVDSSLVPNTLPLNTALLSIQATIVHLRNTCNKTHPLANNRVQYNTCTLAVQSQSYSHVSTDSCFNFTHVYRGWVAIYSLCMINGLCSKYLPPLL